MEMQINVNTKIIYMDSAVPVMRAIENVKRDIRKVCCDSDEKGYVSVIAVTNYHILHHIPEISGRWNRDGWY